MAEYDTLTIRNPLKEAFSCRFNGELYTIPGETSSPYPQFLSFHIAKHLSDEMLRPELLKIKKEGLKDKNTFNPRNAQLMVYDNPKRRISLYQILGNKELVQECIAAFPFKGFIGEMSEYEDFVKGTSKPTKAVKEETE